MSEEIVFQTIVIRIPKHFRELGDHEFYLISRLVLRFDNKSLEELSDELTKEIERRYSGWLGCGKHAQINKATKRTLECLPWMRSELSAFEDVYKEYERLGCRISKSVLGRYPGDIKNWKRKLTIKFIEKGEAHGSLRRHD